MPSSGCCQSVREGLHHRAARCESPSRARASQLPRGVDAAQGLAVDVELKLLRGGVADADRPRAFVAGQPVGSSISVNRRPPRMSYMICSLHRVARHGADEPVAEARRLVDIAAEHERMERERGVAQPAEAVVPVAHAAELLGQAGGRRGDDRSRRGEGQRLEGDERSQHRIAVAAVVRAAGGTSRSNRRASATTPARVERHRLRQMGCVPAELEGEALAPIDGELGEMTAPSRRAMGASVRSRSASAPVTSAIPSSSLLRPTRD